MRDLPDKVLAAARGVGLLLLDVDGVLTDGSLYIDDEGRQTKAFHSRDGAWLKYLKRCGVSVGLLTGRTSHVVEIRARELGIEIVVQGVKRKGEALNEILGRTGLDAAGVGYMGDDFVDLPVLLAVGFSCAPADAHEEVRNRVMYVCNACGGKGAVQEVAELILRAKGTYEALLDGYLD